MPFDCTLHSIDEELARRVFAPGISGDAAAAARLAALVPPRLADGAAFVDGLRQRVARLDEPRARPDALQLVHLDLFWGLGLLTGHLGGVHHAAGCGFSFFEELGLPGDLRVDVSPPTLLFREADGGPLEGVSEALARAPAKPGLLWRIGAGGYLPAEDVPVLRRQVERELRPLARAIAGRGLDARAALDMLLGALDHAERLDRGLLELSGLARRLPAEHLWRRDHGPPQPDVFAAVDAALAPGPWARRLVAARR